MPKINVEEVKKDVDAQKKKVADLKKASKERRKDAGLRTERKALKRLQRRWRQVSGKKIEAIKKAGSVKK